MEDSENMGRYLFNVKAMSKVVRLAWPVHCRFEATVSRRAKKLISALYKQEWVVYAKDAFMG